jgi:DNA-directed RNA polymerase specialized sigma24 family protein
VPVTIEKTCEPHSPIVLAVEDWDNLWRRCWARVRTWKIPPRWSRPDWAEETKAQGALAAYQACCEFDPNRRVPLFAFLYQKVVEAVWTLYRREWTLGRRTREIDKVAVSTTREHNQRACEVIEFLDKLNESDRSLMFQIYWQGRDERELAAIFRITQQGVNKRKHEILKDLKSTHGDFASPAPLNEATT